MGLRVPQNQIVTSKYTAGGEYLVKETYKNYQGYYYEYNNKIYAGKEFNISSPVLMKKGSDEVNKLMLNPQTALYAALSGVKIPDQKPISLIFQYESDVRYFSYHTTKKLIKEISQESFSSLQSNPIYTTISLSYKGGFNDNELDQAELKIPGIKTFTDTSYTNPLIEDDGITG